MKTFQPGHTKDQTVYRITSGPSTWAAYLWIASLVLVASGVAPAETGYTENPPASTDTPNPPSAQATPARNKDKKPRKFFQEDPSRVDAGIFHVALAAGGNFYIEPSYTNGAPSGDFFYDPGFQLGAYFDYDYSELDENIPLMLRGMVGYKYVLSSVHVFAFDGMVRHMWRFSEGASFGLGMGGSFAVWYRTITANSPTREVVLLPSLLLGAGFDFHPFMVDFKWLLNRFAADNIITGFELYFGIRI